MPATEAKTLLQFLLDLLRDPQTQAEFDANPQATLAAAGLDGMCFADVRDALPLVMDHAPAAVAARYDDDVRAASASAVAVVGEEHHHGGHGEHHWIPGPVLPPHTPEVEKVIQQLQYVTNNYAYDSHDVETNLEQNIRANGDVTTTLNQPIASGDGAVAAGGDIAAPVATGAGAVAGEGNMVNHDGTASFGAGDASSVGGSIAAGEGGAVSLNDAATGANTDNSATNFGSGAAASNAEATSDHSDNSTDTATATDNSVSDSGNTDNSQHNPSNTGAGDLDSTERHASPLFAHEDASGAADADTLAAAHEPAHHDVVTHA